MIIPSGTLTELAERVGGADSSSYRLEYSVQLRVSVDLNPAFAGPRWRPSLHHVYCTAILILKLFFFPDPPNSTQSIS